MIIIIITKKPKEQISCSAFTITKY